MKKFNTTGTMTLRRVIGNLLAQRRILPILAVAAGLLPASKALGVEDEINLVTGSSGFLNPDSFAAGTSRAVLAQSTGSSTPFRLARVFFSRSCPIRKRAQKRV